MFGLFRKIWNKIARHPAQLPDTRVETRRLSYCMMPFSVKLEEPSKKRPSHGDDSSSPAALPSATPPSLPLGKERRVWPRQPCDVEVLCEPDVGGGDMHWLSRVVDISPAGLELLTERRFERGTLLTVHGRSHCDAPPPSALIRVVRVDRRSEGRWVLGCRFMRELSDTELRDFVGLSHLPGSEEATSPA